MTIIIMRPFEDITNNIVEITNEIFFWSMSGSLIYYNKPSRWNPTIEDVFMYTILSNSVVVVCILSVSLLINVAYKYYTKKRRKVAVEIIQRNLEYTNWVVKNNQNEQASKINNSESDASFAPHDNQGPYRFDRMSLKSKNFERKEIELNKFSKA